MEQQWRILIFIRESRGSAGVLAIVTGALLLLLGSGYLAVVKTERTTAAAYRDGMAAQYLAEAGLQDAVVRLKQESAGAGIWTASDSVSGTSFTSGLKNGNTVTAGVYTWTVNKSATDTSQTRTVTAIGTVGSNAASQFAVKRTIIVTVGINSSGFFSNTLYTGDKVVLGGTAAISGNATAMGETDILWGTTTVSNGTLTTKKLDVANLFGLPLGQFVTGTNGKLVEQSNMAASADAANCFAQVAGNAKSRYAGAVAWNPKNTTLNAGTYRVNGPLSAESNLDLTVNGNVTIYVDGDLFLYGNNTNINKNAAGSDNLLLVVKGNVYNFGDVEMDNTVVLAGGSYVSLGRSKIDGALFAKNGVTLAGRDVLTYDRAAVEAMLNLTENKFLTPDDQGYRGVRVSNYRNR